MYQPQTIRDGDNIKYHFCTDPSFSILETAIFALKEFSQLAKRVRKELIEKVYILVFKPKSRENSVLYKYTYNKSSEYSELKNPKLTEEEVHFKDEAIRTALREIIRNEFKLQKTVPTSFLLIPIDHSQKNQEDLLSNGAQNHDAHDAA